MINGNLVTEQFPKTVPWISSKMVKFVHQYNDRHLKKLEGEFKQTEKKAGNNPKKNKLHRPYLYTIMISIMTIKSNLGCYTDHYEI